MKAIGQTFPEVLFIVRYEMVLRFDCVEESDHSTNSY